MPCRVLLARSAVVGLCAFHGGEGGLEFVCLRACDCVLSFLVNGTGGGKAVPGLYLLQSSVSIIEEWYLQRGTGVRGHTGRRRKGEKE